MNIAVILRNAPEGTKLYSPIIGECELEAVYLDEYYPIKVTTRQGIYTFTSEGLLYKDEPNGECMLFPSKDNRDWNTFCEFKEGDILTSKTGKPFILKRKIGNVCSIYCGINPKGSFWKDNGGYWTDITKARLATDSEKKELLDAIAKNGYYWDECSMTLKKITIKFKVGDTIRKGGGFLSHTIKSIEQDRYICENGYFLRFVDQDDWNIAKFDIKFLKPFNKVLVRDDYESNWHIEFYSHYREEDSYYKYECSSTCYGQCIPYNNETKHLIGTKEDCPEYYKTW